MAWSKNDLIKHINWLIDNIYVVVGDQVFKQVIGIPMGTDCAPFLANLFLFSYESEWMDRQWKEKKYHRLKYFKFCHRYIDDLLSINNNNQLDNYVKEIYPEELSLTCESSISSTPYLDLFLNIVDEKIQYRLYDKRDAFQFKIVNFPYLSSNIPNQQTYGVFLSQLIRYARCCQFLSDFKERVQNLIKRLLRQDFKYRLLKKSFLKFAINYYHLLTKYKMRYDDLCDSIIKLN